MVSNMGCPTKEEYEKALEKKEYFSYTIRRERKEREDLINKLCMSQKCLNDYEKLLNEVNEIIQKYDIYQEILEENKH